MVSFALERERETNMFRVFHTTKAVLTGLALLTVIGSSSSATTYMVPFDYDSSCAISCDVFGLNAGAPVHLMLGVDPNAISPGGSASASSIVYLNLNFGAAQYSGSSQVFDGATPSVSFNSDGTKFSALNLFGSLSLPSGPIQWKVTGDDHLGFQLAVCYWTSKCGTTAITTRVTEFVDVPSVPVPAVPLPAPIMLLLSALGALGVFRWWLRRNTQVQSNDAHTYAA